MNIRTITISLVFILALGVSYLSAVEPARAQCGPGNCDMSCEDSCGYAGNCSPACVMPYYCADRLGWDAANCCCVYQYSECEVGDLCGGGSTPTPTPTPTPVPRASIAGQLTCQYSGAYPAYSDPLPVWIVNGAGLVIGSANASSTGNYSINNWTVPGYPTTPSFAVRGGFSSTVAADPRVWGTNTSFDSCNGGPYEVCNFASIANTNQIGVNFRVTDVNPTSMVGSCNPGSSGSPLQLSWTAPRGNPDRYLIRADYTGNGSWPPAGEDIFCYRSATELGCAGGGTCTFTPIAPLADPNASMCDYVTGGSYSWWSVQPKTPTGNGYYCMSQGMNLVCPTPTPSPTLPPGTPRVSPTTEPTPTTAVPTPTTTVPPSCTVTLIPGDYTFSEVTDPPITEVAEVTVPPTGTEPVVDVTFALTDGGVVNMSVVGLPDPPFDVSLTPEAPGHTYLQAFGWVDGVVSCRTEALIQVNTSVPQPWWQARGGDVLANGGGIESWLPTAQIFSRQLNSVDDSAGMAAYWSTDNSDTINIGTNAGVSVREDKDWRVKSWYDTANREGYTYFKNKFPWVGWDSQASPNPTHAAHKPECGPDTTCGYLVTVDLTINNGDSWGESWEANEKIVVFVEGDLNINSTINISDNFIDDGGAFLAFVVQGDINVGTGVTTLEGIYLADGVLDIGGGAAVFAGKGTFVGWDVTSPSTTNGVVLGRTFADETVPSELFEYWPQLILNTPVEMTHTRRFYTEGLPRDIVPPTP
jgi:hypothetical protein